MPIEVQPWLDSPISALSGTLQQPALPSVFAPLKLYVSSQKRMRLFFTSGQDPILLDSVSGINALHSKLKEFLFSSRPSVRISAETWGDPAPYSRFLSYIEFEKSEGPILASFTTDDGIRVRGDKANLNVYAGAFQFEEAEDTAHHHPDLVSNKADYMAPGGISLIVEADNYYINVHQHES